jgi:hypothetical protein
LVVEYLAHASPYLCIVANIAVALGSRLLAGDAGRVRDLLEPSLPFIAASCSASWFRCFACSSSVSCTCGSQLSPSSTISKETKECHPWRQHTSYCARGRPNLCQDPNQLSTFCVGVHMIENLSIPLPLLPSLVHGSLPPAYQPFLLLQERTRLLLDMLMLYSRGFRLYSRRFRHLREGSSEVNARALLFLTATLSHCN